MQVAAELRKHAFTTIQSESYTDPVEGKPREVDAVGYLRHLPRKVLPNINEVHFALVCECKLSTDKPWVVFTSERDSFPAASMIQQMASSRMGQALLSRVCTSHALLKHPLMQPGQRLGHSVATAFGSTDSKDRAFDALRSVTHATRGILDFYGSTAVDKPAIAWPVIVVDGPLYECYLDSGGRPELRPIGMQLVAWRNKTLGFHSFVHVVSHAKFPSFCDLSARAAKDLMQECFNAQLLPKPR